VALLTRLVEDAASRDFRQMIAVIGDSASPSIALHARVGFAHIGTLRSVGFKHGRWLDTVLMQRPLGGGDQTPPCSTRQLPSEPTSAATGATSAAGLF
jgi:phosphinothricin acetyltransferase